MTTDLAAWLPDAGPGLLEEAAQAASLAGDPQRAAVWAAEAIAGSQAADPADQARLYERLGRYRWEAGDLPAAGEAAERAFVLLGGHPPSPLQARIIAAHATLQMLLGDIEAALPTAAQAVAAAEQAGAPAEQAQGLATLGIAQARLGELEPGLAALRTSFELAKRPAVRRESSGPRPTTCTCCATPAGSPKRWRSRETEGRSPCRSTLRRR